MITKSQIAKMDTITKESFEDSESAWVQDIVSKVEELLVEHWTFKGDHRYYSGELTNKQQRELHDMMLDFVSKHNLYGKQVDMDDFIK